MSRIGTALFLLCVASCGGQVLDSVHPPAAFPGDWLQFRSDRKLTGRSRLVGNIAPPAVTATSVGIPRLSTLPTVNVASAVVIIFTGNANNGVPQADVSLKNISTSDGYSLPTLGFWFQQPGGGSLLQLAFVAGDPNNQNISGFAGAIFIVDTSARTISATDLTAAPASLQRLLFGVAANLSEILKSATQVSVAPAVPGLPNWALSDAVAYAASFTNFLFQPSPILWSQFIGARQTSVALQTSANNATPLALPAADANAGALASNSTWNIGPATYPGILDLNGNPISFGIDDTSKIGNFVQGSNSYQKVTFDGCDLIPGPCYGHLYQWQNENWAEQWRTPAIANIDQPQTIVGDFDGKGRLEVAAQPLYQVNIYDLLTGTFIISGQTSPSDVLTGRGYGWLGAYDLDGNGTQEIINLGTYENYLAVMGWQKGQLVKLWDHTIEVVHYSANTIHSPIAYPVQDIDGNGKLDIVTSIYNESGDSRWHVVARDGMTGTVLLDLPGKYLVGLQDVNGDGAAELFTIASSGQLIPTYGQLDVLSFHGGTLTSLLQLTAAGWVTQPIQSLPLNINTFDQLIQLVAGPIATGGLPVFFTQQITDASTGTITATVWQWSNGALAKLGTIAGPNLQIEATRTASPGSPTILATATVDGNSATNIAVNGFGGAIVESALIAAPLSSAVVGHLRPTDAPTVIVQDALQEMIAFRPSSTKGGATVLWTHSGRGSGTANPDTTGQDGYAGPLLASLTGDGTLQTVAAVSGPSGEAQAVAIQPDGSTLWTSDFSQVSGVPPDSGSYTGLTLLYAGRMRYSDREDVLVSTQRNTNPELNLVDGLTGRLVWNDKNGSTPGTQIPPEQDGPGGAWVAIYDWNNSGLDDILSTFWTTYWVKNGADTNLINANFTPFPGPAAMLGEVFPPGPSWPANFQAFDGEPVIADFLNNGTDTILFGGSGFLLGVFTPQGAGVWSGAPQSGTPGRLQGVADLDGDGTLSLVSAGEIGPGGVSTLKVYKGSTGQVLWSIPLPNCGIFSLGGFPQMSAPTPVTVGDINGDGRDEAVFACGSTIYVVAANPGNKSGQILWSLNLGATLDTPILADAEGTGSLEIIVVGSNGYIYAIGSQPSTAPPAATSPSIAANGIVDGATFRPGQIAPGSWFTVQGTNLSNGTYQASATPLPQQLGGVVTVNGQIARLVYVATGQINAEMPPDMPVGPANVVVRTDAGISKSAPVQIVPAFPEIFEYGTNRAVAQNATDYSLNTSTNPAPAGGSLVIYFTGAGLVNGDRRSGVPATSSPLMQVSLQTSVTIGGQTAQVGFSGLTPGSVALYQANVTVPADLTPGDYPVAITVGGITSSPAAISVK